MSWWRQQQSSSASKLILTETTPTTTIHLFGFEDFEAHEHMCVATANGKRRNGLFEIAFLKFLLRCGLRTISSTTRKNTVIPKNKLVIEEIRNRLMFDLLFRWHVFIKHRHTTHGSSCVYIGSSSITGSRVQNTSSGSSSEQFLFVCRAFAGRLSVR